MNKSATGTCIIHTAQAVGVSSIYDYYLFLYLTIDDDRFLCQVALLISLFCPLPWHVVWFFGNIYFATWCYYVKKEGLHELFIDATAHANILLSIRSNEKKCFIIEGTISYRIWHAGGVGKRVLFLNSYLLKNYSSLGQMICFRRSKIVDYNKAIDLDPEFFPIKQFVLDRMYCDISGWKRTHFSLFLLEKLEESLLFSIVVVDASSSIEGMVHIMMHHIREIDVVAGPEAYYIPQEFKGYLDPLQSLVLSKSLQYLADVDEVMAPSSSFCMRSIIWLIQHFHSIVFLVYLYETSRFQFLVYSVNRISILLCATVKGWWKVF